ncbi:hypothetical protein R80B4_00941 [Fibrobacteres bacterium R8-0-B4]
MKPIPGVRRSVVPPPRWGTWRVLAVVGAALLLVILLSALAR